MSALSKIGAAMVKLSKKDKPQLAEKYLRQVEDSGMPMNNNLHQALLDDYEHSYAVIDPETGYILSLIHI